MTTPKRLKTIDAVPVLDQRPGTGLPYVVINGVQRVLLNTREFGEHTGMKLTHVRELIKAGRLRVLAEGREYLIPVSEIATVISWADHLDPTA